jgi:2-phosphosulfolactate phosphatase
VEIKRATLEDCDQEHDTVVAIDVLRAFTTAAYAFAGGVTEIILAALVQEAFLLRTRFPGALISGEVDGYQVEGFDLPNSPSVIIREDLAGRTLILRSTAGTQAVHRATNAARIFATGLTNASATARAVAASTPSSVTLVQTGLGHGGWGDEDVACADLIQDSLLGRPTQRESILERTRESRSGLHYLDPGHPTFPSQDLELATEIDRFDFAMVVKRGNGFLFMRPEGKAHA